MRDHGIPPSKKEILKDRAKALQRMWRQETEIEGDHEEWCAVLPWELVQCKRCSAPSLFWEGTRNGKWMLVETFPIAGEAEIRRTSKRRFHDCPAQQNRHVFDKYPEPAAVLH